MRAILSLILAVTLAVPLHPWQVLPADPRSDLRSFVPYTYLFMTA